MSGKTYKINIEMYPAKMIVSFEHDFKVFKKDVAGALEGITKTALNTFAEYFKDPVDKGHTARLHTGDVVVTLGSTDHGVIAHEVFHAVICYLDTHGLKLTMHSQEAFAYLIQYVTVAIYQIIKEEEA